MNNALIEIIHDGLVLPLTYVQFPRPGLPGRFDGSVHYSNGELCKLSAVELPGVRHEPKLPQLNDGVLPRIAGRHVFGGLINNVHFGHFITESLARLWAINSLNDTVQSVVLFKFSPKDGLPNFVIDMIDLIAPDLNVTILQQPATYEWLAVPQDLKHWSYIYGHPSVRKMFRDLLSRLEKKTPDRRYMSPDLECRLEAVA